jgi:hypothetical protein
VGTRPVAQQPEPAACDPPRRAPSRESDHVVACSQGNTRSSRVARLMVTYLGAVSYTVQSSVKGPCHLPTSSEGKACVRSPHQRNLQLRLQDRRMSLTLGALLSPR